MNKMDECIDRDELYTQICKKVNNPAIRSWLGSILAESPTADVAPVKHGKWEQRDYFDEDSNVYVCSVCDEPWTLDAGSPKENNMYYCPNCGAKMDLEEDAK